MFTKGSTAAVAAVLLALSSTAGAVNFPGTGTGAIPDAPAGAPTCGSSNEGGTPLVVSFQVSGLASNVSTVGLTMNIRHPYRGDLVVKLAAPGGTPNKVVFSHTGTNVPNACGDNSPLDGLYRFYDLAPFTFDATGGDWWASTRDPVTPGDYRASTAGAGGSPEGGIPIALSVGFTGLTPEQANGTWTLTLLDAGDAGVGDISAATLYINESLPVSLQQFSVD
ncbi:proprotein convertase P-domain-containing protein [Tahibacter soli]|uniref:Proprotein convertase P-domain-containing protein n=1 Tax=Tahibacter soli TaxID=2983605 RepID=A0A9X3YNB7_9GAMM|nr:proprotein convertase P-domain-containing protein [Tahibacter soli]MDC8013846.1 proprotein convertase P-domain-containing protein [Tahibacter soli]